MGLIFHRGVHRFNEAHAFNEARGQTTELYTNWRVPRGIAKKGLMRERDGVVPPYLTTLFLRAVSAAAHSRGLICNFCLSVAARKIV